MKTKDVYIRGILEKNVDFMDEQIIDNGFSSRADYINYVLEAIKNNKITFARTIQIGKPKSRAS